MHKKSFSATGLLCCQAVLRAKLCLAQVVPFATGLSRRPPYSLNPKPTTLQVLSGAKAKKQPSLELGVDGLDHRRVEQVLHLQRLLVRFRVSRVRVPHVLSALILKV